MLIFPAIDLFDGKAVRLYKGDYSNMTVYSDNPLEIARDFYSSGAKCMHLVDLEGARDGGTLASNRPLTLVKRLQWIGIASSSNVKACANTL